VRQATTLFPTTTAARVAANFLTRPAPEPTKKMISVPSLRAAFSAYARVRARRPTEGARDRFEATFDRERRTILLLRA
jgi:hypothetical protein